MKKIVEILCDIPGMTPGAAEWVLSKTATMINETAMRKTISNKE